MNIAIFGLGYVGCVSLGCLAQNGHNMIGVDINPLKVDLINKGKATIIEDKIDKIIAEQWRLGRISATMNYSEAIENSDISIICVGTPSNENGHLNLDYIEKTARNIALALKERDNFHIIAIRSTVMPGTNKRVSDIISDVSGKKKNVDFAVISNPEFLREGSAVKDFFNPAITVLGGENDRALDILEKVYKNINAPFIRTDIEVAEIIKYVNNTFHALKICFANEIGNICKKLEIDSHKVMDLFCKDTHLNISPYYFKPGYAYGGSCLPKDMKALKTISHDHYLNSPILEAINQSNENQKKVVINMIEETGRKKLGVIGLSFKQGTDDLRYSPTVDIVEYFIGKGYELMIWDKNVHLSKLVGSNKEFITNQLPHLSELITDDIGIVFEKSDVLLVTQNNEEIKELFLSDKSKILIDVIRLIDEVSIKNYHGVCW